MIIKQLQKINSKTGINGIFAVAMTTALIMAVGILPAQAGDDPDALLNYSFAVWVGSGVYNVQDADKRFAVLRAPFSYTFRSARYEKPKFRDRLGFKLLLPAVVAAEEETETDFTFGAAAFVPGLEVQIPVNEFWTLKPFAQFGAGKDSAGGDLRYIYGGGVRSLVSLPWKKFIFGIGNSINNHLCVYVPWWRNGFDRKFKIITTRIRCPSHAVAQIKPSKRGSNRSVYSCQSGLSISAS